MGILIRSIAGVSITDITNEVIVFPVEFVDAEIILLRVQPTPATQPDQRYVVEVKVDRGPIVQSLPLQPVIFSASAIVNKTVFTFPFSLESISDLNTIEGFVAEVFLDAAIADVQVGDAATAMGIPVSHNITMDVASGGLAGYTMQLEILDASIAKFIGVTFPPDFPLGSIDPDPIDGKIVTISAVDLADAVIANEQDVILATIEIEPLAIGTSPMTAMVTRLDDDSGNPIRAIIAQGSIMVTP